MNISEQFFEKLDNTFNVLFIAVNIIVVPFTSFGLFNSPGPQYLATFLLLYYYVPLILLVLLWWAATFFDKLSLRIVCWYGLFYLIVHGLWILISTYVLLASYYEVPLHKFVLKHYLGIEVINYWAFSAYFGPLIPTFLVHRRYSHAQKPSLKRVCGGIFIFMAITMVLALFGVRYV